MPSPFPTIDDASDPGAWAEALLYAQFEVREQAGRDSAESHTLRSAPRASAPASPDAPHPLLSVWGGLSRDHVALRHGGANAEGRR